MKSISIQLLAAMAMLCCAPGAKAVITCDPPFSAGFATAYAPTGIVPNVTQGTIGITCTRGAAGDPTSLVLRADQGLNPSGKKNQAASSGSFISYEAYQDSTCTILWTDASTATSIPFTLDPVLTQQTKYLSYWGCITAANQNVPAGTYRDTVTMEIRKPAGGQPYSSGTFDVTITNPATCTLTNAPADIVLAYTSFSPSAVLANAGFGITCTSLLPYTMQIDAPSTGPIAGTIAGLNLSYSLALDKAANNGGVNPLPGVGIGVEDTYYINGTIAAGQSGICAAPPCSGSNTHTLTITY